MLPPASLRSASLHAYEKSDKGVCIHPERNTIAIFPRRTRPTLMNYFILLNSAKIKFYHLALVTASKRVFDDLRETLRLQAKHLRKGGGVKIEVKVPRRFKPFEESERK